ncbi:MAG: GIY-YIG nuclease family protein [Verrucomicrobia bacterium]|nr:GIY-YIG nuclease family protein [Verrucomicrobiota bacterium]
MSLSIVYVLTNPAMPGLVKIGRTDQADANLRIAQLYTTGVPVPFTIEFACKVANPEEVEKALHIAFSPNRINPKREFFRIEVEQAIAILKLLHSEDATQEVTEQPADLDPQSIVAAEQLRSRRPNLNFEEMNIPTGSILQFTRGDSTVAVAGPRKVRLGEAEMSLTAATRELLGTDYSVAPGPFWSYGGKLISDIYEETYGSTD